MNTEIIFKNGTIMKFNLEDSFAEKLIREASEYHSNAKVSIDALNGAFQVEFIMSDVKTITRINTQKIVLHIK